MSNDLQTTTLNLTGTGNPRGGGSTGQVTTGYSTGQGTVTVAVLILMAVFGVRVAQRAHHR